MVWQLLRQLGRCSGNCSCVALPSCVPAGRPALLYLLHPCSRPPSDRHGWRKCKRIVGNNPCHGVVHYPRLLLLAQLYLLLPWSRNFRHLTAMDGGNAKGLSTAPAHPCARGISTSDLQGRRKCRRIVGNNPCHARQNNPCPVGRLHLEQSCEHGFERIPLVVFAPASAIASIAAVWMPTQRTASIRLAPPLDYAAFLSQTI